jgi:inorganic pyrophosphatase/exopolyphosphatase
LNFLTVIIKKTKKSTKIAERQLSTFKNQTEKLFSNEFKGFDFNVGEKKFRFKVNNVENVKTQQSDINNFIKKFLNENNEMSDAAGYHKSLFTAMNPDAIANHFYEQGKTDAVKETLSKAKNIDMNPRETHEQVKASNGWTVKSITPSTSSSGLKIRTKR